MAEDTNITNEWLGRLVRVLLVFRCLVLLVTVVLLPAKQHRAVIGITVIMAALISYVPLRHWNRIARSLSRHPAYLASEVLLATLILAAAGARSSFFYFTLATAALAGVVYGRRGALPFAALLISAYELVALEGLPNMHPIHDVQSIVFVPMLYPAALVAGVAARELVERGAQTEALLRDRTEDLAAERERLRVARELHDSLAKTVEGLSMSASMLPARCERDPVVAARVARQLAEDARQAAVEARSLMSGLRTPFAELPVAEAVRRRVQSFDGRSELAVQLSCSPDEPQPEDGRLPPRVTHELLRILSEALVNVERHSGASSVTVSLEREGDDLRLAVTDDGSGLDVIDIDALKAAGHYGLAGMYERARAIGGSLTVESAPTGGTMIEVRLPAGYEPIAESVSAVNEDGTAPVSLLRPGLIRRRSARVRA